MRNLCSLAALALLLVPGARPAGAADWHDKIDLPFVDDPAVLGAWHSVDFVDEPGQFDPKRRRYADDLYLKELAFLDHGRTTEGWWTWTKGVLIHHGDKTASQYLIKDIGGAAYMFLEWKSGDYMIRHMKPKYYVLKKTAGLRTDDIDLPFQDDPKVLGRWESVDFVKTPADFDPGRPTWQGDLYLKEMVFLKGGRMTKRWLTWTRGFVLHSGDKTAARYSLRKIGGTEYMFLEWKSGDYVLRGMTPFYYVLKRAGKGT
jgi:bla regulator protein BlaR1